MKAIKLSIILALAVSLTACKKYDEGPAINLRTPEKRIAEKWVVSKDTWDEWEIDFKENGNFYKTTGGNVSFGTWEFSSGKDAVTLTYSDGDTETYNIVELNDVTFHFFIEHGEYDGEGRKDYYAHPRDQLRS